MRLLKMRLTNYRRFVEECSLEVNERLIALVGPNEAGKSSILDALELLGNRTPPTGKDVSRSSSGVALVEGLYALDDTDRAELADAHQGSAVAQVWVTLRSDEEKSTWALIPRPRRDLGPRRSCEKLIKALKDDPLFDIEFSTTDALLVLGSTEETLGKDDLKGFAALARQIRALDLPENDDDDEDDYNDDDIAEIGDARESAASALVDLAQHEGMPAPVRQCIDALVGRLPQTAFFKQADRELQSEYDLDEVSAEPPPALENLCCLAQLDLVEVKKQLDAGRLARVEKLIEDANTNLKERFQGAWSQSSVFPRLSTSRDGTLNIFIATEGEADYSDPDERSDGLRWFMALHAFLAAKGTTQPILLVDEAETHLHYDAQADLVDALMSQRIASKVVYSTHSVGCLPPDLGRGIRAVVPSKVAERSGIENSYWSIDRAGNERISYAPLLFAMGASMLAWTVPRFAVVAEGTSDAILLPTLLREAAQISTLPYRIVPGLSEIPENQMTSLVHHAGSMVFLADGDAAGVKRLAQLRKNGVISDRLLHIGIVRRGSTLEDLVTAVAFAEAVNQEIETWGLSGRRISATQVPNLERWKWLQQQDPKFASLSKNRVAQRIVDLATPEDPTAGRRGIAAPRLKKPLAALHAKLLAKLMEPHPK